MVALLLPFLKKLANRNAGDGDWLECFILLGIGRSSKRIFYNKKEQLHKYYQKIEVLYLQYEF